MLVIHRAERADRLVDALADVFSVQPTDPLATEVIAVHSRGIERWIAQELSRRLGAGTDADGICANVAFPFPSRLVRASVAAGSGFDPRHDPWSPERLTWPLLEFLHEGAGADLLGPLADGPPSGEAGDSRMRRFSAVRHVADLFDRYGVHRPDMIKAWRDGRDVGADLAPLAPRHRWQPRLWRALRRQLGVPSLAERLTTSIATIRDHPERLDLPPRLAVFGVTAVPASYLEVLDAIAHHRDVHLLLLHPSPRLWSRIEDHLADHPGAAHAPRREDPTQDLVDHPLLSSWGRDARELQLLIARAATAPRRLHHHPSAPAGGRPASAPDSLLARVQHDLHNDRHLHSLPAGADGSRASAHDPTDRSLQVHACHGRLRQVEVLRDALLHLLADDPALEPRDVVVMCPDIETYAPLISAVFGAHVQHDRTATAPHRPPGSLPPLRVRLADRSLRRTNPILDVASVILELPDSRLTASSVLDLLTREPVRRRFRLDDDDLARIETWIGELGIRWGLDGEHRRAHGLDGVVANTWRHGLDRLQAGIAMADEDLRLVAGIAPFDGVEGQLSDLAGRLTECIERLSEAITRLGRSQPVLAWREAIGEATDRLAQAPPTEAWQRLQLHRMLDDLVDEAAPAGEPSPVPLTLGEIRGLLDDRLRGRPTTAGHRTGDLTICTLVPMRSVPHRVVALLGLDDDAFPRRAVPDSDDLLGLAPQVGDRETRSEDRQLLLDAVLAATDTVVITYSGHDERTNEPRPPAVPVDELLDAVERTVPSPDGRPLRHHLVTHHPLQAYDPRSFEPGALHPDGRCWGFDPAALAAAKAVIGPRRPPADFLEPPGLADEPDDTVDLDDLVALLQHPARAFANRRLQLSLAGDDQPVTDSIPVDLSGLDAWTVGEQLLTAWRRDQSRDRCLDVLRGRGVLPPGQLAARGLDSIEAEVDALLGLCRRLDVAPGPRRTVDVQLPLEDGRTLIGSVADVDHGRPRLSVLGYSRVRARQRLAAWVKLVALTAHDPDTPWEAVTLGRNPRRRGAVAVRLRPLGGDPEARATTATTQLHRLLDLHDRALRLPVPLYAETSLQCAENLHRDLPPDRFTDRRWETRPFDRFPREDADPYHELVLGGRPPFAEVMAQRCLDDETTWSQHESRFVAYAWRLWQPVLSAERMVAG